MKNPNLRKFYSDFYEQTDRRYRYYPSSSEIKLRLRIDPASAGDTGPIPDLQDRTCCRPTRPLHRTSGAHPWSCALHSKRNHHGEKPAHRSPEEPLLITAEKAWAKNEDPAQPKEIGTFLKEIKKSETGSGGITETQNIPKNDEEQFRVRIKKYGIKQTIVWEDVG